MLLRICTTLLILTGFIYPSEAQSSSHPLNEFFDSFRNNQYEHPAGIMGEYKGSPYENDEFIDGEIYTNQHIHFTGVPLRYNIYQNKMEFRNPSGEVFDIDPPEFADTVLIGESRYIYYSFRSGLKTYKSFFRKLTGQQPLLLCKLNVIFRPGELPGGYKDAVPASFDRTVNEYYLAVIPGEAVKIDGKKDILEKLSGHARELDQFIKQNKIKTGKEEDLVKLMEYYYTLAK
jgi:hypothetical protein